MIRCKAKSKRSGERCKNRVTPGREVCRVHGGKTPRGLANPNTKTGKYSKDLPTRLVARYEEGVNDPDLASVNHELALIDSRLIDLLKRVDSGEAGQHWRNIKDKLKEYDKANTAYRVAVVNKNGDDMALAFAHMEAAVREVKEIAGSGLGDYAAWDEIGKWVEQRRRMVETKHRRDVQIEQTMTVQSVMLLLGTLVQEFKEAMYRRIDQREAQLIIGQVDAWVSERLAERSRLVDQT